MQVLAGTSGYSYAEWKGAFYPAKLPASEMLHFYAEHFATVEINNTFYRMPAETMLARWAREVPAQFAFTLKAPRRITHEKRLREVAQEVAEFVRRAAALGDKLGVILFQLPPYLRKDLPLLEDFLALLPPERRVAVEFRHASWQDDAVYEALTARGAMSCVADTDKGDTPLVSTADCGYLRLRPKLVAMMLLLLLLSLASLFLLYWQAERRLVAQVERHTTDLSTAIRVSVEQLTSKGRTTEARLQDYVQRLERRGVREISILSNEREVIASSNPGRVGARIDPRQRALLITARLGEEAFGEREQKIYNLIVPITVGAQPRGYILVSMILDDFATLLRVNLLKRIFLTVFVFAVGIAGSLALAWRVTRPIQEVVEAARRVASGDLSQTLPAERRDEIGELERSFNEMVERLRANRALEARLHQAERLSAIGQLASGIAHEVRNPLNFINLSIDFLRSRYAPPPGAEREEFDRLVESVKKEVPRLDGMIENFLILGKPLKLDRKPCRVEVLLDDVAQVARQKAAAQQIQVEEHVAPGLPAVVADGAQLKTCFMNLMVNAFQAMPQGGRLQIAATPMPGDAGDGGL